MARQEAPSPDPSVGSVTLPLQTEFHVMFKLRETPRQAPEPACHPSPGRYSVLTLWFGAQGEIRKLQHQASETV